MADAGVSGSERRLDALLGSVAPPPLPAGFTDRVIRAALAESVAPPPRRRPRPWMRGGAALGSMLLAGLVSMSAAAAGYLGEPASSAVHTLPLVGPLIERVIPVRRHHEHHRHPVAVASAAKPVAAPPEHVPAPATVVQRRDGMGFAPPVPLPERVVRDRWAGGGYWARDGLVFRPNAWRVERRLAMARPFANHAFAARPFAADPLYRPRVVPRFAPIDSSVRAEMRRERMAARGASSLPPERALAPPPAGEAGPAAVATSGERSVAPDFAARAEQRAARRAQRQQRIALRQQRMAERRADNLAHPRWHAGARSGFRRF
ncbi:hypothetical protein ABDK56_03235 [Sphingomonas sp. ASV193]|uniref:hypothetical protein n=1 Tax=Sphingomonas sp. ASV193 TaxID=3144405 RepID=UPI0032E8F669